MGEYIEVELDTGVFRKNEVHYVRRSEDGGVLLKTNYFFEGSEGGTAKFILEYRNGVYVIVDHEKGDHSKDIVKKDLALLLDKENSKLIRKACSRRDV